MEQEPGLYICFEFRLFTELCGGEEPRTNMKITKAFIDAATTVGQKKHKPLL